MRIVFVGTGAADISPLLQTAYQNKLGLDARRSSSVLLNGHILVDCGPHAPDSLRIQGIDLAEITDLFVTHFHADHYDPTRGAELASQTREPLRIWYRSDAVPAPVPHAEFHPLPVGATVRTGECTVKALAANHTQYPLHYDIETADCRLFYGCDGAWLLNDTFYAMRERAYDVMILDGTVGDYNGDFRLGEHNSIPMIRLMLASFRTQRVVAEEGVVCLSHIAPTLHTPHAELVEILKKDGMIAAFDGMVIERAR